MRLMIVILAIALLVIVDQFRVHGYYPSEVSRIVSNAITSITR